jgi:anthranilate synthase/aminodeoxychorismate synthase-like glutamine amidotransferase
MILFIDHRDSFSWNLIAQLRGLGYAVAVRQSEEILPHEITTLLKDKQALVFSPGPGHPRDYPNSLELYRSAKGRIPIIGVCLGFQIMLEAEGISVGHLPEILHGVQTPIRIDSAAAAYKNIHKTPHVGRYHSLGLPLVELPNHWRATGWDAGSGHMLSFENLPLRLFGFQYHPDSFLTPDGDRILANVLAVGLPEQPREATPVTTGNLWEQLGAFTTLRLSIRRDVRSRTATLWFPSAHSKRLHRDLSALAFDVEQARQLQNRFVSATKATADSLAEGEWLVRWSYAPPRAAIEARVLPPGNSHISGQCIPFLRSYPQQKNLYYNALLEHMRNVDRRSTEVLLVHPNKELLLEGITCNLLFIRKGQCFTPLDDCLPGLTLQLLESQLAPGISFQRTAISLAELDSYDAIIACGTGRGVTPISAIPELNWRQRDDSLITTLQNAYQSLIHTTNDRIEFSID